jgi:hypothetical protein
MLLGDRECDYDTAYFMKYGKYPPVQRNCTKGEVSISDALERDWNEPNMQYIMWQGCNLGSLDWIQ